MSSNHTHPLLSLHVEETSSVWEALVITARGILLFLVEESLLSVAYPASITLELGTVLVRTYPSLPNMAASLLQVS